MPTKYIETNIDLVNYTNEHESIDLDKDKDKDLDKNKDLDKDKQVTTNNDSNTLLDFFCNYSFYLFIIYSFFLLISGIVLITVTILYDYSNNKFWINQLLKYVLVCIIQYGMALLVKYKNAKVNYTRKVIHISYFLLPQLLDIILLHYTKNKLTEFWNLWIILVLLIIMSEHIRDKISVINTMFMAVDRPEDKPYTLIWFSSQIITSLIVLLPFSVYFSKIDEIGLIFIPILINALADGLAEPIGIKFGKHKYKTKGCLSNKEYERSYEGSLCVFTVSLIIICSYYNYMDFNQFLFCSLTIPLLITFTEAFSPHTWDSPLLFLVSCSLLSISTCLN